MPLIKRSIAMRQVPASMPSGYFQGAAARYVSSIPQCTCRSVSQRSTREKSSSPIAKRRRTGSSASSSSTLLSSSRLPTASNNAAIASATGVEVLVVLSMMAMGSCKRALAASPSTTSRNSAPITGPTSGAYVSISGQMTMMSRGCSVGSAAKRCKSASRNTSTWRVGP